MNFAEQLLSGGGQRQDWSQGPAAPVSSVPQQQAAGPAPAPAPATLQTMAAGAPPAPAMQAPPGGPPMPAFQPPAAPAQHMGGPGHIMQFLQHLAQARHQQMQGQQAGPQHPAWDQGNQLMQAMQRFMPMLPPQLQALLAHTPVAPQAAPDPNLIAQTLG
jgi:hypothetical protein